MKRGVMLVGVLTLVVSVGMVPDRGQEPPRPQPPNPVIAALDADQGGTISAEEIAAASTALLALDLDGDGILSEEELRPPRPDQGPEQPEGNPIMRHDADGDGVVTYEEFIAPVSDAFGRIDTNGDGTIDADEARAAEPPRPPAPMQDDGQRPGPRQRRGPRGGW